MVLNVPVMIPSKGRAGKTKVDKLLVEAGIPFCFVVEKPDYKEYEKLGYPLMVLDDSDQGISYARDFILRQMRKMKYDHFWMLDDDISEFGMVVNGRAQKKTAKVLTDLVKEFEYLGNASLYCMAMRHLAWCSNPMEKDKVAMHAVYFDVKRCENINYDLRLKIREDVDLSFQAIFKADGVIKYNKYYYNVPEMGSVEGGMSQWYNQETEMHEVWKLCRKWPGIVDPLKKDGRIDIKINWRKFK